MNTLRVVVATVPAYALGFGSYGAQCVFCGADSVDASGEVSGCKHAVGLDGAEFRFERDPEEK